MKIETQPRDDHQVTIIAEIEPEIFEKAKHQAARKISKETKISGFRPGKAPYDIVRRMVGDSALEQEAVNLVVDEVYPKVLDEAKIEPFGPGNLEEIQSTDPLTFRFTVPLKPTVALSAYRDIRKTYEVPAVDEDELARSIDQIRSGSGTVVPVERPAEEGDMVMIDISAVRSEPAEGEEDNLVTERPFQTLIRPEGETLENEWPYPGFCRELIGVSAGEEKKIEHTFSEDCPYENLRGKAATFTVKIQSVKHLELPELTDEFVQTLGEFENVDKFKQVVRDSLEHQAKDEYENNFMSELIDQIIAESTIQYPPQALDEETESVLHNIEHDLAQQSLDLDTYLKIRNTDKEAFIDSEVKPAAVKRLQRSLVMDELAQAEEIKFDNDQFEAAFGEAMYEIQNSRDYQQMRKQITDKGLTNAVAMETASRVINRQIFDRLKLIVTGQEIPVDEASDAEAEPAEEETPEPEAEKTEDQTPQE